MPVIHDPATRFFDAGENTFEIRRDDRRFQEGDFVRLFKFVSGFHNFEAGWEREGTTEARASVTATASRYGIMI